MESGERLASPSSAPSSLHRASSSAGASPAPAPAPPHTPSDKCGLAPIPSSGSPITTCGHLFRMAGDQHFNMSGISSAFPLVSHPAFGLFSANSGRSEFGGLGTLGVSAALASHPQLSVFPDWWRASEAHGHPAAALFPPLLGLPPMFAPPFQSHNMAHFHLPAPSKNGRATAKGTKKAVNSGSISSSSAGNCAGQQAPIHAKKSVEKTSDNNGSRGHRSGQPQVQKQASQKANEKKLLESSSVSGSQSGSSSDSSSDGESSSDLDDPEEGEDDLDEDDDPSNSDDSDSEDGTIKGSLKPPAQGLTSGSAENKRKRSSDGDEARDKKRFLGQRERDGTLRPSSYLSQSASLSTAGLFHSPRTREDEATQHTSVIQATGSAATNKPLAMVTHSHRETSSIPPWSPPKPLSLGSSPMHFSFPSSSSPKRVPPSTSPKHPTYSSSPKYTSSSPVPLSLCASPKPLSLSSSPKPCSSPKPPTQAQNSPTHKSRTATPGSISALNESSLHAFKVQPFLPQDSFKQAFSPPKLQDSSKSLKQAPTFSSPSLLPLVKPSRETPGSQALPPSHGNHANLFLSRQTNGVVHDAMRDVQDAPLALITKPRSHSTRAPSNRHLSPAAGPPFSLPVNLSTGAKAASASSSAAPTASTSCGPANRSRKSTAPKPLHAGKSFTKSNLSLPVDAVVKSTESDIPSSKDSDDSLGDDEEDDENDEDDDEDSDGSLSESDSNLESDSDGTEGSLKARGGTGTETEAEKTPPKLNKALFSLYNSSSSSSSLSASFAPLNLQVIKPHGPHSGLATPLTAHSAGALTYRGSSPTFLTPPGPGKRRRVTDEQVLRVPLQFGWQRETRIRTVAGRLQGEVAYYAPCGKKLRQYPDVMKYLSRNGITEISRDNFSFSTKIKVGDFYEVREGPKGFQWFLLKEEEIGPCIIAMDGRRSRHSRSEQQQSADSSGSMCKEGHPPNFSDNSVQDVNGVKLLRKLEAQEIARQAAQIKLMRKLERQAMVRAAKEARRQQAIMAAEERRKKKEEMKMQKQQEKMKRIQHIRMEKELRAQQILEAKRKKREEAANAKTLEAEKRSKEKELRRRQAVLLKHQELERHRLDMEKERRRQHLMLMKAMEARKKTEERERLKQEKRDEKRLNKERKLELKRLELEIAKELKKPNEDMCLADHKNLPELSRIPGLVLSGNAFSDCLMVMQFLHSFGKVLGLDVRAHVPNLSVLQEGLLNVGNSMGQVQGLLVCMLSAAVCDPGLPPGHRTKTALGDHLTHVNINADNVSEILQMYMEAQCEQTELAVLAHSLKTKAFQAHTPAQKASILAFLVNELCCSKAVVSEIDKTIDYMTNLRKDKWIVEGKLRKLRSVHAKRTGRREGTLGSEDGHTGLAAGRKHRRKDGDSEEDEDEDDDSEDQGDDDDEDEEEGRGGGVGRKGKKAELCDEEDDGDQTASVEELEKQIEKLSKQQSQIRRKLFDSSHSLRSTPYGQDRHKRRYWHLLQCGGILVEGMESGEGSEELEKERQRRISTRVLKVKEEQQVKEESSPAHSTEQDTPESLQDSDSLNLFLQKPGSFSKLSKLLEVANISPDSDDGSQIGQNSQLVQNSPAASATIPHAAVSCSPFTTAPQLGAVVKPDAVAPSLFSVPCLGGGQPILPGEQLLRALTERSGHWFSLLPRSPCDESSVTSSPSPQASSASPPSSSSTSRARSPPSLSPNPPPSAGHADPAGTNNLQLSALQQVKSGMQQMGLPFCSWPSREPFSPLPPLLALAYQHSEGGSNPFLAHGVPAKRSQTPESHADKPLGTPSPTTETTKNQDYPDPQPIPEEMTRGWWRVSDMEQLEALLKALHSRGVREKGLQKQLQKHMEYMAQACTKSKDVMGSAAQEEQWQVSLHAVESWSVEEQAMEVDIGLLQQVEALERKVTSASLQVKSWMHPDPQSEREDLVYYEHKPPSSLDLEGEGEASQETRPGCVVRRPDNPLDIAVGKLAELERSIERSGEEEGAPGMRLWRKALGEVRSSAQLSLCIQQLQKTIAWERSIMKAYCQLCRKGDNEELLLLCDGCDKGCHTYCHRPKITTIPDGDWFCPACMAQGKKQQSQAAGGTRDAEPKPNKRWSAAGELSEDEAASPTSTSASSTSGSTGSGSNGSSPRKGPKETKKRKGEESPPGHQPTQDSPAACGKKAKTAKDNTTKDLAICRVLLADLETQQDAWPFLIPVNHKAVPGYKKVIKRPMDFSTIREKLITNQYLNLETFIIDVNLVFDNCEKFNEDNSEIGRAGHSMRRFFDRRWTELLKQTF